MSFSEKISPVIAQAKTAIGKIPRKVWYALAVVGLVVLVLGGWYYQKLYAANIKISNGNTAYINIPTGAEFDKVCEVLRPFLKNESSFVWTAEHKNYPNNIKAGRYKIVSGMSNNELVNMLRLGKQAAIKLTFNNARLLHELAGKIDRYLEADSLSLIKAMYNDSLVNSLGFNRQTLPAMFIPNTYEFKWNTTPLQFLQRMKKEYEKFWTAEKIDLARKDANLNPVQISTIASIVQSESNMRDEYPRIAGVYINRLKKGMPLQADPTVKFALGDFSIKRVLNQHIEQTAASPYNTYKHEGLPPGPICLPDPVAIEAVLHYEHHNYLYFCAREDFSGYSNFAETLEQHNVNASRYQRALSQHGIR